MDNNFEFKGNKNPKIVSATDSDIVLKFYLTKKDLQDYDIYTTFVNAVKFLVRKDFRYTNYKAYLMSEVGLDHCQVFNNISSEMADLEIHHFIFDLFDISSIVTDHMVEENKRVTSFSVADEVLTAHEKHMIPLVMLCETAHEAVEKGDVFLPYKSAFGQLDKFIVKYKHGLHREHYDTLTQYMKLSEKYEATDNRVFELIERVGKYTKK